MSKVLKIEEIQNVLILGAGTLGLRVGLQAAISGYQVSIYDTSQRQLDEAKRVQHKLATGFSKSGQFGEIDFARLIEGIMFTTDPGLAARNADIVNESVTEDIAIKEAVWKQFGELCPPHTVFTTNTSFLLPSMFADASGRAERFCAFHFHDVFVANVVDIMPHPTTSKWVIDLLYDFGKRLKQTPIKVARESSGYVFNHMLMSALQAAIHLLANGISTVEDIDRSWMGNFNMPVGPFGMLDQIGLDTACKIAGNQKTRQAQMFAEILQEHINNGNLGVKTGKGFYDYPNPAYQKDDFL